MGDIPSKQESIVCYKTLFFIYIHIIHHTISILYVILQNTICISFISAMSNCTKYENKQMTLLSVLFISFLPVFFEGAYCILKDISFCILLFLFYLCRTVIKKS